MKQTYLTLVLAAIVTSVSCQSAFAQATPASATFASTLDLTGNWTNDAGKDEPLFHLPLKSFRLAMTAPNTFMVPGLDTRARVLIVNNEPRYLSHSGAQLATGTVVTDPASGAVVSIRWSVGTTWTRSR